MAFPPPLLLLQFSLYLIFALHFFLPNAAGDCPQNLLDGQMLDFANPGGIRLQHKSSSSSSENTMCPRMLLCDVISAPSETVVEWFYNGRLIRSSSTGILGSLLLANNDGKGQLGLSETSHRLCVPELFARTSQKRVVNGMGLGLNSAVVTCRARLACNPSKWLESKPFNLAPFLVARRAERAISSAPTSKLQMPKAPVIYLVTSSRMDVAGNILQILCRSNGNPKPKNVWTVFAVDGMGLAEGKERPIKDYPFIMKMNNGDLLVDTAMTENASMSLRCRAKNAFGEDSANSTIILLKE